MKKVFKYYSSPISNPIIPSEREKAKKKIIDIANQNNYSIEKETIADYYYDCPLDENSILIFGLGGNVRGSMQYILNELNYNEDYANFSIFVRTTEKTDDIVREYIACNNWKRTHTVSKSYSKKFETCKYLITESYFPYGWIKRQGQVMIDIWHGTPIKKIGVLKNGNKAHLNGNQQKNFLSSDYMLYPNRFTEDVMNKSFKIGSIMHGKAIMLGYPRTQGLLSVSEEHVKELKKLLAPNGEKIFAYMPTFRGYMTNSQNVAMEKEKLDYIDAHLPDDYILYVNLHHHVSDGLDYSLYKHIKKFPPLIDSYELLTSTDGLISDYSSVFMDYLTLGKQIILHAQDLEEYSKKQGFNCNYTDLPFDIAYTNQEVIDAMIRGKKYDDSKFRNEMCAFDTPESSKKLCRLFLNNEYGINVVDYPLNDKKKVLVYSHGCQLGKETELLVKFSESYDKEKIDLYIGCDADAVNNNLDGAYPFLHNVNAIASQISFLTLSAVGNVAIKMYKEKVITLKQAMDFLKYDYALVFKRMYGSAIFDYAVVYDNVCPDIFLGLAHSTALKKVIILNKRIFERISDGDIFLRDAIKYSVRFCNAVAVSDATLLNKAQNLINKTWGDKIQVISTPDDIVNMF